MNAGVLIVAASSTAARADLRSHRLRVQRAVDRARAAAALSGRSDLDPPPPGRAGGAREPG